MTFSWASELHEPTWKPMVPASSRVTCGSKDEVSLSLAVHLDHLSWQVPRPIQLELEPSPPTLLGTCGWRQVPGSHLVKSERVECALLHCNVIHFVGLQGHPSQGPASLLAGGPGQLASEMGILALAELHILQGLQNGHLGGCTKEGVGSASEPGMLNHQEHFPVLESAPSTPPQFLQISIQGST